MPLPLLFIVPAITAALSGVTVSGLMSAAGTALAIVVAGDAVRDWFDSDVAWEQMTDQLNKRLSAAGLDLQFPVFNPTTQEGQDIVKSTIEKFALDRINAKAGTNFTNITGLTQENFLGEMSGVIVAKINTQTGSNLGAVWPVEKLQDNLKTEVLRQFDNRGRYAGGALFKVGTLSKIKEKIAAKHPALMAQVKKQEAGGYWGPPRDEKERLRREAGKERQRRYRATHQQIWYAK